jgi:MFS transporter, ACS family, tartrate transporter
MTSRSLHSSSQIAQGELGRSTLSRVSGRLLPFLVALYIWAWIDRTNLAIAALEMQQDLRLSSIAYGFGAGVFFLGYALFEVPSNLILVRVGARRWIARIAISWGLVATTMMFVRTPVQFYIVRVLLGFAEAGLVPGIIYYLSLWFPARERGAATARFMIAAPLAGFLGNALGGWVLGLDGQLGLHGWQWLFLIEGIPSIVLGVAALRMLTDRPEDAEWLSNEQREWLVARLRQGDAQTAPSHKLTPSRALAHPMVWLLSTINFLMAMPSLAYSFWAPLFVREALHTSTIRTGLAVAGIACFAIAAMLLNGAYSDRTGKPCLHAGAGAVLVTTGCLGAALLPNPLWRVAALALVEIGVRSYVPPFLCLAPALLRGTAAAAGIALVNTAFSVGGFFGPSLIGWFKDSTGSTNGAFLILAVVSAIAAALCVIIRRHPAFGVALTRPGVGLGTGVGAPD